MDTIANWHDMMKRMKKDRPYAVQNLRDMEEAAVKELSDNGSLLAMSGETISQQASRKNPEEKLDLAGEVGRFLIKFSPGEGMGVYSMKIWHADGFANCIAIAVAAILEKFNGKIKHMKISCSYSTEVGRADPLGSVLPLVFGCFPFVEVSYSKKSYGSMPVEGESKEDAKRRSIFSKLFG